MNDDVEGFYTNPIPNEHRSRWLSGLKCEVFGRAFQYRIGIGFVGIVVPNLIVYYTGLILYQFYTKLLRSTSSCFAEDHAPVRSILKTLKKIALPCEAF